MSYPGWNQPYDQAYGYQQYPPPAPPPAQPYYGYTPPPPQPSYHAPPPAPYGHAQPRYDYAAYAGYAPPPPQPQPVVHASPPPPAQPPLREGELRPPPDVGVDPNSFRRFFSQQLAGLTFNSKPVITNLTLFAHEHLVRMSAVVAQCLEEHLRTCPPQYLLPSFYLLDSISKNIGPPYLALFSRFLERAFLSAYHSVDAATKVKLEELLGTWKTGGSDGGELFRGSDDGRTGRVQRGIESALFGPSGRGGMGAGGRTKDSAESYIAGVQQLPHAATTGERSGVLYDVRRLLATRQEQANANPDDQINQGQILALKKLESLILNTQLTTEQVNQIRAQLAALAPRAATSASPPPVAHPAALAPPPAAAPVPAATVLSPAPPAAPAAPAPTVAGVDLNLLSQLSATGALANLFGNAAPPAVKQEEGTPAPQQEVKPAVTLSSDEKDEAARVWEEEIMRLGVKLENADLAHPRPNVASLLYVRLPLQCQQCGLRFFDSREGKLKMDEHLDWHFTYKRRIREGAGRAQGRSWFTKEDDWYTSDLASSPTFAADDPSSASSHRSPSKPSSTSTSTTTSAGAATLDRAQLQKQKVPVGADGQGLGDKPCPICQDRFKSEWSDDEEEWVWWNAVVVDGTLYHATCHAEASLARASAAASVLARTHSAVASREGTPVAPSSLLGSSLPLKRKAEEEAQARAEQAAGGGGAGEDGEREVKKVKSEPGVGDEALLAAGGGDAA
ncbi:hypothetical protein JCM5296_007023 [Sporobolomyces johnsonii]